MIKQSPLKKCDINFTIHAEAFLCFIVFFKLQRVFICNNQPLSQQHSIIENNRVLHASLSRVYLLSCLHFSIAVQEVTVDNRAHNGQAFSCFQLRGKGEQSGIFYMEVLIQFQQHQQLRSAMRKVIDYMRMHPLHLQCTKQ